MAIINCPKCGNEISDKALICPHCNEQVKETPKACCNECGNELEEGATVCPKCGCPVEITKKDIAKTQNRVKFKKIILAVVLAVVICVVGSCIKSSSDEKKAIEEATRISEEYTVNLSEATRLMLDGASEAESAGGLIHDVWANAIYEERDSATDKFTRPNGYFVSDFNDALSNLFADTDFMTDMVYISSNQDSVKEIMKALKNPPAEYAEAYETINEFYSAYLEFTNLVLDPQGNLQTFTSNFNDLDSEVVKCYEKMMIYLED